MSTKLTNIIFALLIVGSIIAGYLVYPSLPAEIASHWDVAGNVNGYMSRFWGVALLPLVAILMWGLFAWLPKIDPLKENIVKFRPQYNLIILAILLILLGVYKVTILWNLGYEFNVGSVVGALVSGLVIIIGLLLPKIKRNYFLGIRTPWTLESDKVWNETHQRSGPVWVVAGVIGLVGTIAGGIQGFWMLMITVLAAVSWSIWLSYNIYSREKN